MWWYILYRIPTLAAKKISDTMMQGHGSQCKNLFLNLWHKINKAPKHNQTAQNQFDTWNAILWVDFLSIVHSIFWPWSRDLPLFGLEFVKKWVAESLKYLSKFADMAHRSWRYLHNQAASIASKMTAQKDNLLIFY